MTRRRRPPPPAPSPPAGTKRSENVLLKDLAGMVEARAWGERLARDIADYKAGKIAWADVDPGVMLVGDPGVGKTFYAKALGATCAVPVIVTSYATWQRSGSGNLGDVMQAIEAVFAEAAKRAPCILFFDEADSLPTRGTSGKNDEWWRSVINATLEALDGLNGRDGIVVVGACNDGSTIDPALLRSGRFDRQIRIPLPTVAELGQILRFHLPETVTGMEDLAAVSILLMGMTAADVKKLVRDSCRVARQERRVMRLDDVAVAIEAGRGKAGPEFLRRIAIHEAGHAVAALRFGLSDDVTVSILSSGSVWGRTMLRPGHAIHLTRERLELTLAMLLAGRAAECVVLGCPSGGAGGSRDSDLASATRLATDMVVNFGLSERGLIWYGPHTAENPILSDRAISEEVSGILDRAYALSVSIIDDERTAVEAVADALLTKRALPHDVLVAIIAASRPAKPGGRMELPC